VSGSGLSLRSKPRRRAIDPVLASAFAKRAGMLDLLASTPVAGEWPLVVDVLNPGSPMAQPSANRKAAVGVSTSGLPTMIFDGTDVYLWPASPAAVSTGQFGLWFWSKYSAAAIISGGTLFWHQAGVGGATLSRFGIGLSNGSSATNLAINCYATNANGRGYGTPFNGVTHSTWYANYLQYDASRGGDACHAYYLNGASQSFAAVYNIGAGATLGTLQAANGSILLGGITDSDTPTSPLGNGSEIGSVVMTFNQNLTAAEIARLLIWRRP
jgi:hypothetical protein